MQISISDERSDAGELAKFFHANITPEYISHSELQGLRAKRPGVWSDNIEAVLRREIEARLRPPLNHFPPDNNWKGVVEGRDGGRNQFAFPETSRELVGCVARRISGGDRKGEEQGGPSSLKPEPRLRRRQSRPAPGRGEAAATRR